jgi:hypothetical protein
MNEKKSRTRAREENATLILATTAGVAIGLWAASKHTVLGEEKDALIAMAGAMVGSRLISRVNSWRRSSACCGSYAAITSSASTVGGGAGSSRS